MLVYTPPVSIYPPKTKNDNRKSPVLIGNTSSYMVVFYCHSLIFGFIPWDPAPSQDARKYSSHFQVTEDPELNRLICQDSILGVGVLIQKIPGSSRYVKFLPKLVGFFGDLKSTNFTHKRKIQVCIP